MRATSRAVTFVSIVLLVPAGVACNILKRGGDDAGAAATATATAEATVTAPATTAAATSAAPVATIAPAPVAHKSVAVKLPDGGTKVVDAGVLADGAVVLPPGFQFPTIPGFDASAIQLPQFQGFDAAALPKFPSALPSGFPALPLPGLGGADAAR